VDIFNAELKRYRQEHDEELLDENDQPLVFPGLGF
jgi:hypothetical protein